MRKNIDFEEKVESDYRKRIIIDRDNPVLAFKASRDRYTRKQGKWAGYPYLGSNASEDALTWNVFLTLYKRKKISCLFEDYKLGRIRALALWGLTPDIRFWNKDTQFDIGDAIRKYDGTFDGQTTEPDVIIRGSSGVCVIECKLGSPNSALSHLWEGKIESINKRIPEYTKKFSSFKEFQNNDGTNYYQLIRMAFYAMVLSEKYKVTPHLVSLTNKNNWRIKIGKGKATPEDIWNDFCNATIKLLPQLKLHYLFWQDINSIQEIKKIDSLYRYLKNHPCLR